MPKNNPKTHPTSRGKAVLSSQQSKIKDIYLCDTKVKKSNELQPENI